MFANIRQVLAPPTFEDVNQTRVATLLNYMLIVLLFLTLLYILITIITTPKQIFVIVVLSGLIILYIAGIALIHSRRVRLASQLIIIFFWLAAFGIALLGGGVNSVSFNAQLVVILMVALLLGRRGVIVYTILSVVADIVLVYMDDRGLIPTPVFVRTPFSTWVLQAGFLVISGVLLLTAVRYFNELLRRSRRDEQVVAQQNQVLQAEVLERNRAEAALRANQEAARGFQERLKVLHEVSIELTKTGSVDELCQKAVELGRQMLGYDRLGIWFFDESHELMLGTYGTDIHGNVCDEREFRTNLSGNVMITRALRQKLSYVVNADTTLYRPPYEPVGHGWNLLAMMMDGDKAAGWIASDNLLSQRPLTDSDVEILKIYASTVGHLANRKRLEEAAFDFQVNLKILNEVGIELSRVRSLDELYRKSVEIGREFLSFDRMGIWILDDDPNYIVGTYGTDEQGNTRDERDIRLPITSQGEILIQAMQNRTSQIFEDDEPILNHYAETVGRGGKIFALLWNGDRVIGSISADNLLNHRPITNYDLEILTLYGSMIGHYINRLKVEANLLTERNLLRTVIDTTRDFVYVKDTLSRFVVVNKTSWLETPGVSGETDLIGKTDFDFFPPEIAAPFRADEIEIFNTGKPVLNQEELGRGEGENQTILLTSKLPLRDQEGNIVGLVGVSRDITEQKRAERERLELALQKERLDLLAEFIGNMSHDLKTPLSIIKTSLYLLERLDDPARQQAKIKTIKEQTQLLEKLIQDVLTMSRLDHGTQLDFAPVSLNDVILDVEAKLHPTVERKQQSTHLRLDANLPCVLGSEEELWRMLTNLVENALNYTPEEGTVTVQTSVQQGMAVIEVQDTGIGIDKADMPRIFDRFYRADPARSMDRGGTGLGLAIVKRIVDMHDGTIQVESTPGQGSIFRVCLNLHPEMISEA